MRGPTANSQIFRQTWELPANEVHVWSISIERHLPCLSRLRGFLVPAEVERARRFCVDRDRAAFIAGRGIVRLLLGHLLGRDPSALSLKVMPAGKPFLEGSDLQFNISHSGDCVLIAMCRNLRVGVDVEIPRSELDLNFFARHVLTANERDRVTSAAPRDQSQLCNRFWTRKEAYAKAIGLGLLLPFTDLDVSYDTPRGSPSIVRNGEHSCAADWVISDLDCNGEAVAAVATEGNLPVFERTFDLCAWEATIGN